ncbi:rDNA transcriptional regulator pol5 [Coccinella septempunctata]|uniref:rDNA transcriptional regulator pol5 n=1 Tax=Coccinella septempunctata TaxID=41139 RepID=UPI001D098ACA|nr:rDNA transcriptional regulator pol5 [Coccinella septempunctata]
MEETHVEDENIDVNDSSNHLKIKTTILDNFKNLTKDKDKVRNKAGAHLVKYLIENQENETEYKYALGRLIRGLGSSTVSARCGFYSTFMPLLNLSDVSVEQIFEVVEKELHKGKSNSKSENADVSMGHILVCTAIIRSGLYMKSSDEDQKKVLDCILNAGKERSYLLYPAYELILDLVENVSKDVFQSLILPVIKPQLEKPFSDYNLDSFYFLIMLTNKYPKLIGKQILKKISSSSTFIAESNLEAFSNILLAIPKISSLQHPVYELFGKMVVKTKFTIELIKHMDKALSKYNKNKHLVIINFLTIILKNIEEPNDVPHLLEQNFIQQTITVFRQLKGNEKDLQLKKLTHTLFDTILEVLKKDDVSEKTKISILKRLLFHPGTFIFEKITKSKLVQNITSTLKNEGVKELATIYKEVVMLENEKFNADTSETFQNNDRLYAANLLVKLLCHPSMHEENEWKCQQLKFFMQLGLTKQPKVGVELASSLKDTFFRSLDLKLSKLEHLSHVLLDVFNELDSYQSQGLEVRSPLTEEVSETWSKAKNLINKIQSKKTKKIKLVFEILFLHLSLQLFNDVKLAKDSLEELFSCYERLKKKKDAENENDPAWIEVVVELFLSLLSHNSSLLRKVVNCVFPHLCQYLNATAVHQILSVLDPNNEDNPLTNKGDISDDDDMSEDDEGEELSDEEDESDDEEVDDEEESSEEEDLDETKSDKLRKALQIALMQNTDNDGVESDIDIDQIDEEQGEKLNKALGDVFKQFKTNRGKSKKQNKNDETLTHFRIRALDLIEIFLDSNPSMILTLEILVPLLQLLEFSIKDNHQKPLQNRVKSCLKKMTSMKKFADCSEVTDKTLCDFLGSLLEKGTRNSTMLQFMGNEISQCCVFIIRCSQVLVNNEETPKKVKKHLREDITNIIKNSLDNYMRRRDCHLPNQIFKQTAQLNWNGNIELLKYLSSVIFEEDIKPYKKNLAADLIRICFTNHRLLTTCDDKLKDDLKEIAMGFLNECQKLFGNLVENQSNGNVREKFISYLFIIIAAIKKGPLEINEFQWKDLGEIIREYRSFIKTNQETKKTYNTLCSALGVSNIVQMKQSIVKFTNNKEDDDESSIISGNKTKKSKKKANNDKMKLKKEAKEERMKSLSEGLEGGFSNVENMNGHEPEADVEMNGDSNENVKSKKRKMINGELKKSKKMKTSA